MRVWDVDASGTHSGPSLVAADRTAWSFGPNPSNEPLDLCTSRTGWAGGPVCGNVGGTDVDTVVNYYAPSTHDEWRYVEFECTLTPGMTLENYVVTENGSLQTSTIYPDSWCFPNGNTSPYAVASLGEIAVGNTNASTVFQFWCGAYAVGQTVEIALSPPISMGLHPFRA